MVHTLKKEFNPSKKPKISPVFLKTYGRGIFWKTLLKMLHPCTTLILF